MRKSALIFTFIAFFASARLGHASVQRAPEAQTPEEFDLYLDFHDEVNVEAKHAAALRFENAYSHSELLAYVYESELDYFRGHNSYKEAVLAGEHALQLAPTDVRVLATMAEILPYGTEDPAVLAKSEEYGTRVLEQLRLLQLPQEQPLQDCETLKSSLASRGHAALGYVAGKRGNLPLAIRECETALMLSPEPDGSQLFRLGKLYQASGRADQAAEMFRRAARAGPPFITKLADVELQEGR
jgi:tetratricopeptide (TPR) repeat protein